MQVEKFALTPASPFPLKLKAYLAERFPLSVNGPAILLMFASAFLVSAQLQGAAVTIVSGRTALGILVLFFFFLRLRISDEHKDVHYDRIVNPDRLVVRGIVTLGELKAVGAFGLAVEVAASWALGPEVFATWVLAAFWSWLMHMEFFVDEWLRARPAIYMLTHMVIIPLLTGFCFQCARPFGPVGAPVGLALFALASVLATASLETARKIRLPADEAPGVESYSSSWGFFPSLGVVGAMQLGSLAILVGLRSALGLGPIFLAAAAVSWGLVVFALARFGVAQDRRLVGKLEKVAALYFMTVHIGLTASLWR
ncbi:MAG: hypothetical protein HY816_19105 [Candidatus Wallbacteria bacterium]|nr:hypothetical protein [Candidatus Wallbacteria bacterium]